MKGLKDVIKCGSLGPAADARRAEYDIKNSVIVVNEVPVDIVFMGDSITHAWEIDCYFSEFGLLINRGIWGDPVATLEKRFECDVVQLKPKVCVLMAGLNDTWILDEPAACNHETEKKVKEIILGGLERMAAVCKNKGIKLILCSLTPMDQPTVHTCELRKKFTIEVNEKIKKICKKYDIPYADYHAALTKEDGRTVKDGILADDTHFHVLGYNIMAEVLKPILRAVL